MKKEVVKYDFKAFGQAIERSKKGKWHILPCSRTVTVYPPKKLRCGLYNRKRHGDTSEDTAVSFKKGDFITPTKFAFLKKKTAALIVISKPSFGLLYFLGRIATHPPKQRFFLFPVISAAKLP